jgi:tetratricopeptide (TPR) repeat protein
VPRLIIWLPTELKTAIEKGLNQAVDRGYELAPETLGEYYEMSGQFDDEAHAYERAANLQDDPAKRAKYLKLSGEAFARAGALGTALITLREAAESAPDDAAIYSDMAVLVYGPRRDVDGARRTVELGIENGADPFTLSVALADAARVAGDRHAAEEAMEQALRIEPNSQHLLAQLGNLYAEDNRPDRALLVLNRALEIEPNSPATYFQIGGIEEGRYQYYNAERAYQRAVSLSPDNQSYRDHLAEFERKLKAASKADSSEAQNR